MAMIVLLPFTVLSSHCKRNYECMITDKLLNKLHCLGFAVFAQNQFRTHLSHRTQMSCTDGLNGTSLRINKGVPQGSVLGLLLFPVAAYKTTSSNGNLHTI